jgi:hypothetical protein
MGFARCIVPDGNCAVDDRPADVEVVGIKTVTEALDNLMDW